MTQFRGRHEPAAELRTAAAMFAQMFAALTDEGFTTDQATAMIGQVLAAQLNAAGQQVKECPQCGAKIG